MAGHAPTPCASGDTSDQWQTGFRAVHVAVVADPRWEAPGETAAGFGCSPESSTAPELGFGIAHWSASRRVYVAPEVRIGAFPNVRLSLVVGFTGGRTVSPPPRLPLDLV